jgi:hypothetical protein
MKRIVWTFGLIAGAILAAMVVAMVPFSMSGDFDLDKSEIVGYASMVLAFVMVFVGIRSYRENAGGAITFGRAQGGHRHHPDRLRGLCRDMGDRLFQLRSRFR